MAPSILAVLFLLAAVAASAVEVPRIATILAVGDSITRHGPSEKLGWSGDWGMAASAREKDWAHLLQAKVAAHQGGTAPTLLLDAAGGGRIRDKLARREAVAAQKADLIVVQLGENENNPELIASFEQDYESLVGVLRGANPQARIICLGVWGNDPTKDAMIRRVCAKHGAWFASIAAACADPANWAKADKRWTHAGVNWHPGDRGMEAYAATVWRVLSQGPDAEASPAGAATTAAVVLREDFSDAKALAALWKGPGEADAGAWRIALSATGSAYFTALLPVEKVAGQRVRVTARIRAENVSPRPKAWNGIKLQLALADAEDRKDWPQATVGEGTFAWTEASFVAFIPRNTVRAALNLGLEAVSGTVWFDDVKVETLAP